MPTEHNAHIYTGDLPTVITVVCRRAAPAEQLVLHFYLSSFLRKRESIATTPSVKGLEIGSGNFPEQ